MGVVGWPARLTATLWLSVLSSPREDIQAVRGRQGGDVNPENTAKLADGAIECPARVMVVMCAELDDASIIGFDRR